MVGYEVKTTQNGRHAEDICDMLAGKYPKDFKFVGWHPNCMCYAIPILKTEEEFWDYDPDAPAPSRNEVTDTPPGFKDWIKDNEERIARAEERGKLPYFIKDNRAAVQNILQPQGRKKTTQEIAAERHAARTPEDIKRIQTEWDRSRNKALDSEIQNIQSSISIPYNNAIESILQGNELRGRNNKDTLFKYLDALDTLGNGTRIFVPDLKWKIHHTSDSVKDGLTQGFYSSADIKHILSVIKTSVANRVAKLPFVSQLHDLHRIKIFDGSSLPIEWK